MFSLDQHADFVRQIALETPGVSGCNCYGLPPGAVCQQCVGLVEEVVEAFRRRGYELRLIDGSDS